MNHDYFERMEEQRREDDALVESPFAHNLAVVPFLSHCCCCCCCCCCYLLTSALRGATPSADVVVQKCLSLLVCRQSVCCGTARRTVASACVRSAAGQEGGRCSSRLRACLHRNAPVLAALPIVEVERAKARAGNATRPCDRLPMRAGPYV